jgi:ABC-type transport system involved in cytochrome c biogenesis permease subunit
MPDYDVIYALGVALLLVAIIGGILWVDHWAGRKHRWETEELARHAQAEWDRQHGGRI